MATTITITNSNKADINIKNETTCILHIKTPEVEDIKIGIGDITTVQNCQGDILITAHADTASDLHELVTQEVLQNTMPDEAVDKLFDDEDNN